MPAVDSSTRDVQARFREECAGDILLVTRRAASGCLATVIAVWPFNFALFDGRPLARLAAFLVSIAICVGTGIAARRLRSPRHALPLAVGFTTTLGIVSIWALSLLPLSQAMVGTMATMMVGVALIFPWGLRPQLVVSGGILLGFLALPDWRAFDPVVTFGIGVHVVEGLVLSLAGAVVLDRHRLLAFIERDQTRAVARQRAQLVDVGRELNATVQLQQLLPDIVARCADIVGTPAGSLVLLDETRRVLQVVAIRDADSSQPMDLVGMEFPMDGSAALLADLRRDGALEVSIDRPAYDMEPFLRTFQVTCALLVAIVREGHLLGYMGLYRRDPAARFTEDQRQVAIGVAHQAAVALVNAHLVDDLRAASRLKSEFVSTMSHELRTPLNVIMGYTEMIADVAPDPEARHALDRIRSASRELLELIEATLDLGRLESGRDVPTLDEIPLREFWNDLQADFTAVERPESVRLEWRFDATGGLRTDRRKLKIIVKNLVGNAIKYTPTGSIVASCVTDVAGCTITVRDTGIGIAPEQLPSMFEMFRQGDGSDKRTFGGVGLGLYIVRRLLDQLGGTIAVESTVGQGSTFRVHLPHPDAATPALDAAAA